MQIADPLGKLTCIRDRRWQEHKVDIIRQQDDCLFPDHSTLCQQYTFYVLANNGLQMT